MSLRQAITEAVGDYMEANNLTGADWEFLADLDRIGVPEILAEQEEEYMVTPEPAQVDEALGGESVDANLGSGKLTVDKFIEMVRSDGVEVPSRQRAMFLHIWNTSGLPMIDCAKLAEGLEVMLQELCPKYWEPILPDEEDRCSLCGAPNQHGLSVIEGMSLRETLNDAIETY